ncbi:MAG: ATP-binding protein [Flavobacteriales bacterium]
MENPELHRDEERRLARLLALELLDTPAEADYDDLTRLAAQICGTPVSLVTLLDDKRQWFKSKHGLNAPETPREVSFCGHAIHTENEPFIVPDARNDERFHDNPLVTGDLKVVFYAGIPLTNEEGLPFGTLCVIDHQPRQLTPDQIDALRILARQVMRLLDLRKASKDLQALVQQLKSQKAELERFASVMAHDLKTPLANISGLIKLFQLDHLEKIGFDGAKLLDMIDQSSGELRNLIDGVLSYSRASRLLNEEFSEVRLDELTALLNRTLNGEGKATIQLTSTVDHIWTNKSAIQQILLNLVSNALKYNDKDRAIVELYCSSEDDYCCIEVRDNGPGIEPNDREKIFNLFQTNGKKDRYGERGTGIGLATVKRLAEALEGSVECRENGLKGASFVVRLPKLTCLVR